MVPCPLPGLWKHVPAELKISLLTQTKRIARADDQQALLPEACIYRVRAVIQKTGV